MGIEFMFVKIIWPQGVVYPCLRVYMIMYFKHLLLCNHLANQKKISYVAFLQRDNEYLIIKFCLFVLRLNVPVNNFSVMLERSQRFLGLTSTVGS